MKENARDQGRGARRPKAAIGMVNVPTQYMDLPGRGHDGEGDRPLPDVPWPECGRTGRDDRPGEGRGGIRPRGDAQHAAAEIKMTYAELASVRKQIEAVRRSQDVLKDIVGFTEEIFAVGKGSQPDVLRGQVEFGRMREMLWPGKQGAGPLGAPQHAGGASPRTGRSSRSRIFRSFAPSTAGRSAGIYEADRPARKAVQARVRKGDSSVRMAKLRREARVRGLRLLHAAGRHARRDEAVRHGVLDGDR